MQGSVFEAFFSLREQTIAGVCMLTGNAVAQPLPCKVIRVINPSAPGGNSDIVFRLFAGKMGEILGQQLVLDYRPGAGGTIGGGSIITKDTPPEALTVARGKQVSIANWKRPTKKKP